MYLTRFRINTARRQARKLLASPQAMHAAVLGSFPEPPDPGSGDGRVLWRIDRPSDTRVQLYILSPIRPDLFHLVEQAGWPTTETWRTESYQGLLDSLEVGQQWAFRLTANPTRNRRLNDAERTQRVGHVTIEHQRNWLLARAENAGFHVVTNGLGEPDVVLHQRNTVKFERDRKDVTLRTATYDGRLEVTDATAFRRTLTTGLGHAKAYGCGLLTLAPLR